MNGVSVKRLKKLYILSDCYTNSLKKMNFLGRFGVILEYNTDKKTK